MISLAVLDNDGQLSNIFTRLVREHPEIRISKSYTDPQEALSALFQWNFDILAISASLPEDGAWKLLRRMNANHKTIGTNCAPRFLIVGSHEGREEIMRYIEAGAKGYISQTDSMEEVQTTMQYMLRGEARVSPDLAQALMARLWELSNRINRKPSYEAALVALTPREDEILHLVKQGMSNHEIAELLSIEVGTVKNHVHNILEKLGVSNRKQAAEHVLDNRGHAYQRKHQVNFASAD
jgi:DNA-binding NarL/FixJ family response regulator